MVDRWKLMFWTWVVLLHDRLHADLERQELERFWHPVTKDNATYTSPSVHYLGNHTDGNVN